MQSLPFVQFIYITQQDFDDVIIYFYIVSSACERSYIKSKLELCLSFCIHFLLLHQVFPDRLQNHTP